jgi:hypothetical protein
VGTCQARRLDETHLFAVAGVQSLWMMLRNALVCRPARTTTSKGASYSRNLPSASRLRRGRALGRRSGGGQESSRSTTEVAQVNAARISGGRQTRGQVQRLVHFRPGDRSLLPHVAKDRDLGP